MFNRALRLIDWLNAFGAIEEPSYKDISLGSARCGPYESLASFDATVMFLDREFLDSNITTAPKLSREMMAFALEDMNALEAVRLFATTPRDGFTLYKVLEVVAETLGLPPRKAQQYPGRITRALRGTGWIKAEGLASLIETLNNPNFGGAAARHALRRPPRDSAARPLSQPDLDEIVRRLLFHWLAAKAAPVASEPPPRG